MTNSFSSQTYRSPKTLSYITIGLFGGLAFCSLFFIMMSIVMLFFPDSQVDLGDGESMNIGIGLIGLGALLEIALRIPTIIFFLIWEYRAFANLSALKAENLEFSPGWAVGWWFIPFANLVKPFQAVRELYNESDPNIDAEKGFLQTSPDTPALITFWWATYLISNVAFRVADALIDNRSGQPSEFFPPAFLLAGVFSLTAALLVIFIVRKVTANQELRFGKVSAAGQFSPPPPPTFNQQQ
jgi:hypothetical protein